VLKKVKGYYRNWFKLPSPLRRRGGFYTEKKSEQGKKVERGDRLRESTRRYREKKGRKNSFRG